MPLRIDDVGVRNYENASRVDIIPNSTNIIENSTLERTPEQDMFVKKRNGIVTASCAACALFMGFLLGLGSQVKIQRGTKPELYGITAGTNSVVNPSEKEILDKQKEVLTMYRDGENVYVVINPDYEGTITSPELETLLNVNKGTIEKYNNLDMDYERTAPDENGDAGEYTTDNHEFGAGDFVKIPYTEFMPLRLEYTDGETIDDVDEDAEFVSPEESESQQTRERKYHWQ